MVRPTTLPCTSTPPDTCVSPNCDPSWWIDGSRRAADVDDVSIDGNQAWESSLGTKSAEAGRDETLVCCKYELISQEITVKGQVLRNEE